MNTPKIKDTIWFTWLHIIAMVAVILGIGYFAFIVVSDKGIPSWDYRPVKNIPSESVFGTYKENPAGQHVSGKEGNK